VSEHNNDDPDVRRERIARNETSVILRLRLSVVQVLVAAAIAVAIAVYSNMKGSEQARFENQLENNASKILRSVGSSLDKAMGDFDSLSVTLISAARALNQEWPFVTIPDYALRISKILPVSKVVTIQLNPLVTPYNRLEWERYARENQHWENESLKLQERWSGYYGPVSFNWKSEDRIYGEFEDLPYNLTYVHDSSSFAV
jgi:hypothetical protein